MRRKTQEQQAKLLQAAKEGRTVSSWELHDRNLLPKEVDVFKAARLFRRIAAGLGIRVGRENSSWLSELGERILHDQESE